MFVRSVLREDGSYAVACCVVLLMLYAFPENLYVKILDCTWLTQNVISLFPIFLLIQTIWRYRPSCSQTGGVDTQHRFHPSTLMSWPVDVKNDNETLSWIWRMWHCSQDFVRVFLFKFGGCFQVISNVVARNNEVVKILVLEANWDYKKDDEHRVHLFFADTYRSLFNYCLVAYPLLMSIGFMSIGFIFAWNGSALGKSAPWDRVSSDLTLRTCSWTTVRASCVPRSDTQNM